MRHRTGHKSFSRQYVFLVIVSLLAILWVQTPNLLDKYSVDEDFRSFYWMNKFQDPDLFPDDPLRDNTYLVFATPWGDWPFYAASIGYSLSFFVASFVVPPIFFSKMLAFFLLPVTVWYLYRFGKDVSGPPEGTILAMIFIFLNLASPTSLAVIPGLQRSFALTLIIILIYYLHQKKYMWAAAAIVLATLIYAPMFILAAIIWGLTIIENNPQSRLRLSINTRALVALVVAVSFSVLVMIPTLLTIFSDVFVAPTPEVAETSVNLYPNLWDNPQYQEGGRSQLFDTFPLIGRGGLVNKDVDALHFSILFAVCVLIYLVRGRNSLRAVPRVVWSVLWASLIMFVLAWVAVWLTDSFLLYLPSRYTRVGLFIFLFMFVGLNIRDFLHESMDLLQKHRDKLVWLVIAIEAVILGLIIWYPTERATYLGINTKWLLAPAGLLLGILAVIVVRKRLSSGRSLPKLGQTLGGRVFAIVMALLVLAGWMVYAPAFSAGSFISVDAEGQEVLQFVETLPKDTVLAGTPCALDSIPLYAKRQVLFSCERMGDDEALILTALKAYYADDVQTVVNFCQTYGIEYLMIDSGTYTSEFLAEKDIFYEPYNQELRSYIAGQGEFVLPHVPDNIKIFQSGTISIFPCQKLVEQN